MHCSTGNGQKKSLFEKGQCVDPKYSGSKQPIHKLKTSKLFSNYNYVVFCSALSIMNTQKNSQEHHKVILVDIVSLTLYMI